jgi:hypothetical protein
MQRLDRDGGRIEAGGAEVAGQRPMAPSGDVVLTSVIVNGVPDPAQIVVPTGGPLRIELRYRATREVDDAVFRVQLFRNDGLFVHGQNTARAGLPLRIEAGEGVLTLHYEHFGLLGGDYYLSVGVWPDEYRSFMTGEPYDHRPSAAIVRMVDKREDGAGVASFGGRWAHHAGVRT